MTRDEIVAALRCISTLGDDKEAHCDKCPFRAKKKVDAELAVFIGGGELHYCDCEAILFAAADLIENQQRHIEALMKANDSLKDAIARRDKQIEDMKQGIAQLAKAVAVKEEQSELHAMKNELCQYCGKYKYAHEGACNGCKWWEM